MVTAKGKKKTNIRKIDIQKRTENRRIAKFRKKIIDTFTISGFTHLATKDKEVTIGKRKMELDSVHIYDNILVICEDTTSEKPDKDHIRSKNQAFSEIYNNKQQFINWLKQEFKEKAKELLKYDIGCYRLFFLYFSQYEMNLSSDDIALYDMIRFVSPQTLEYLHRTAQCLKLSSKYEIFRFLRVEDDKLGPCSSGSNKQVINAPIIYPKNITGLKDGVRVASFMMRASVLIRNCYVMRKDSWEESMFLYQRLIDLQKIKRIRAYLFEHETSFYNNIIVGLSDDVTIKDQYGKEKRIEDITGFSDKALTIEIPDKINNICIIDGQHRVFAYYEGGDNDKYEGKIKDMRDSLHLLVTGLIFPKGMDEIKRTMIQSEIFMDINANAKPVPADLLLHIERMRNPFSDVGIARQVIEQLNKKELFLNKFELSSLDENKIKVASIIKFALRYLVAWKPANDKKNLYTYWTVNKEAPISEKKELLNEYIDFCTSNIQMYFSAIRDRFTKEWEDKESKLLSVIAINGFIIAYNRQLESNGINGFEFYKEKLKDFNIDFSKDGFKYTSSQYKKFSDQIMKEVFSQE